MADQPVNPGVPTNSGAAAQGQGPARSATGNSNAEIQSALDAMSKFDPMIASLADVFGKLAGKAGGITEKIKDWGSELHQVVGFSDEVESNIKAILGYQIKMAREGMKAKDYESLKAIFGEMHKTVKGISEDGILGRKGGTVAASVIKKIEMSMASLEGKMKGGFDPAVAAGFYKQILSINKETLNLTKNLKGVRLTGVQKDIAGAHKALAHLFGKSGSSIDKWHKYAQTGREIKEARAARNAGRHEDFKQRREALLTSALSRADVGHDNYRRKDGSFDIAAYKADWKTRGKSAMRQVGAEAGMGAIGSRIFARHAAAEASGGKAGFATRAGMGLLAHGEGSLTRGLASWGSGMVEGGIGGIAEMAAPLAPFLAVAEALKATFDKNQKMNSEVNEKLGSGGIYGGGGDVISQLGQTRKNLNATGIYNSLGMGYDKNLALAQQMVEGGFSVRNLSQGPIGRRGTPGGALEGSFGTMQMNAYAYGKVAGLSPTQTMTQTLKLITQYQQSLGATEDFFVRISRDARAAGISTMKYIDIIDQTNSQYDRSNKLLMVTVATMKALGQTGRDTADDLKDAMDVTTNGGQKRSLETSAYLGIQQMKDPGMRNRMVDIRQGVYQSYLGNAAQATGISADQLQAGITGDKSGGIDYLNKLKGEMDKKFENDPTAHQSANKSLEAVEDSLVRLQAVTDATARARTDPTGAGLGLGVSNQQLGQDRVSQTMETLSAFNETLKVSGHQFSELGTVKGRAGIAASIAANKGGEFMGWTPEKTKDLPKQYENFVASIQKVLSTGYTDAEVKDHTLASAKGKEGLFNNVYDAMAAAGTPGFEKSGKGQDKATAVKNMALKHPEEFFAALDKMPKMLDMMFGDANVISAMSEKITPSDKQTAINNAQALAASTRPTADIFADAFTWLFNQIITPLEWIQRALAASGKFSLGANASAATVSKLQGYGANGTWDKAMAAAKNDIDAGGKDGDASKSAMSRAERAVETLNNGGTLDAQEADWLQRWIEQKAGIMGKQASTWDDGSDLTPAALKLKGEGVKFNPGTHSAMIGSAWKAQHQTELDNMVKAGQITAPVLNGDRTQDAYGNRDHYNITVTNVNTDYSQQTAQTASPKDAGQTPSVPVTAAKQSTKAGR